MYILLNLSSFIFLIEVLCAKIEHDHCACEQSLNRTSTASMVDVRLFLVYFSLQLHHHHHHLVTYLTARHGAQAPRCPSPPLRDVGLLSGGQCELRRTTGWAKRRRHEGANTDTKHPAMTR